MPRRREPPRLYYRAATDRWFIRDGGRELGTGARGAGGEPAARLALARYVLRQAKGGKAEPARLKVSAALAVYAEDKGPQMAAPERLAWAVRALAAWWKERACDEVIGANCRAYAASRPSAGTARRELGVLQAALNHCAREGLIAAAPLVTLPPKPAPRARHLTRVEAARLLRAAAPHLRRAILLGLYTGTRPGAILRLRWTPALDSGWVDLEAGVLHRAGARERRTKKRRGSCPLPAPLLAHLRRWREAGVEFVVEWRGGPVKDIGTALDAACRRAGVERITPHVLKHTAATWARDRGLSIDDAADYFSTTAETLRAVYTHETLDSQRRAAEIMGRRR